MVPVGEAMAEALLESDESTASLSEASIDKDSFDEVQTAPSFRTRCTVPFKPRNRRGGNRNKCVDTSATVKRPQVQPLSLGGPERPVMISRHVALDCESKCLLFLVNEAFSVSHLQFSGRGRSTREAICFGASVACGLLWKHPSEHFCESHRKSYRLSRACHGYLGAPFVIQGCDAIWKVSTTCNQANSQQAFGRTRAPK